MAKEKETKAEVQTEAKVEAKAEPKAEPKAEAKASPKVDKKAFVERKLKAINKMNNAFIAELQAERIMSRR